MASAYEREKLNQGDPGVFQKPGSAEPSAQYENHGANQGRVDPKHSLGGLHPMLGDGAGGEGVEVQANNQNAPSARMVLAEGA